MGQGSGYSSARPQLRTHTLHTARHMSAHDQPRAGGGQATRCHAVRARLRRGQRPEHRPCVGQSQAFPPPGKQQELWLPDPWLCTVTVRDGAWLGSARLQVLGPTGNLEGGPQAAMWGKM